MLRRIYFLLILVIVCGGMLTQLDRFLFKKNKSFSLKHILFQHPQIIPTRSIHHSSEQSQLLDQNFFYLNKGKQAFVFESEDHQYVIKIYRLPSTLRQFPWTTHLSSFFSQEHFQKKVSKFNHFITSITDCYQDLRHESQLVMISLGNTQYEHASVKIVDAMQHRYAVPVNQVIFIIQKKASLFFLSLESALQNKDLVTAKQLISGLIDLFHTFYEKGYEDIDAVIDKNYGVVDNQVIIIDVGQIRQYCTVLPLKDYLIKKTDSLKDKLQRDCPSLLSFYWECIEK